MVYHIIYLLALNTDWWIHSDLKFYLETKHSKAFNKDRTF